MATNRNFPKFRATRNDGTPGNGWKLYSYLSGSSTPKATFTDQTGVTANPNPTILNGAGEASIWLAAGGYKFVLTDENDVVQWTEDRHNLPDVGEFTALTVTGLTTLATVTASGQITSTAAPGTAPLVIASDTEVANLNAAKLKGKTWTAPDPIGLTTPASGRFTTLTAEGTADFLASIVQSGGFNRSLASVNNAKIVTAQLSEEITLNTAGTTTDSVGDLLEIDSVILAVVARITVGISVATNWALGDAATAARFLSATTDLIAGTTKVGLNHMKGAVASDAAGPTQAASAKLRITTTGTPAAGKIRVTVFFLRFIAPLS
jgi:hypothetical protein